MLCSIDVQYFYIISDAGSVNVYYLYTANSFDNFVRALLLSYIRLSNIFNLFPFLEISFILLSLNNF